MDSQTEIVDFLKQVQKIISKHGLSKVLTQLRTMSIEHGDGTENVCEYIITLTRVHYAIDRDVLLNSKKRGRITEARRMCFALMKEHLPFSDEEIGNYFGGRSRQYVNRELMNLPINQDKFSTKHESKFVNDFISLTMKVVEYKKKYNQDINA